MIRTGSSAGSLINLPGTLLPVPFLLFSFLIIATVFTGCNQPEIKAPVEYSGPITEFANIETFYTEKEILKMKMRAKVVQEYQNGDREFPEGLYVEFYDATGALESTLEANHAFYFKKEDQWRGRGNVQVKNLKKNEQLNTEELFWKPSQQKIFTDKFVTIRQETDVIYGTGLEAKQDMSDYTITNPEGIFDVEEEAETEEDEIGVE
jgi:LPS export ABC transporter protein LptC